MRITITSLDDQIFTLDVSEDLELIDFKAFCEVESGISSDEILLVHNGQPLTDPRKTLKDHGLADGDIVIIQHHRQSSGRQRQDTGYGYSVPAELPFPPVPLFDFSGIQVPSRSTRPPPSQPLRNRLVDHDDPAFIRDSILNDPEQVAMLKQNNPELAEALLSGNFEKFSSMIREIQKHHAEKDAMRLRLLQAHPFDAEAQKLIADEIKQKNIDANMEAAMEFNPEIFGTVVMLYINCNVNGHPVKAFIDSGAQTTIMSTECAERCNIMRLVDTRFSGIAKGVGTQKIIGRIHMGQIQIGDVFLTSSFSVLEDQKMDMLLGLDMLKRHQCTIDLKRNVLTIGTTGTETPFLAEGELPESARLTNHQPLSVSEHEEALAQLGGEDVGLARAIEESVRDQGGKGSNSNPSSSSGPK